VFWWGGWISLALTLLNALGTLILVAPQPLSYGALPPGSFLPPSAITMLLIGFPYHLVLPIVLFLGWGMLTALVEIHAQLEEQSNLMREDGSAETEADAT
jgi:hypothetical protein